MRKWETYSHMNRNYTMLNHCHTDEETSPKTKGHVWLQNENKQMEIIELDSNDSEVNTDEEPDYNFGQIWNYLDKDRFAMPQPDANVYKANQKAREKRRMRYCNESQDGYSPDTVENNISDVVNELIYSHFYGSANDISERNNNKNHQSNCFTILNKSFNSPDPSTDEVEDVDVNSSQYLNKNGAHYDGEIITFDEDMDSTKRMIWIYSFKNKREISDHDFELVNIPSQDSASSTSCSLDNFCEELTKTKKECRASSPIPATYVPRLNLSVAPTLPTVTEIAEPNKMEKKDTIAENESSKPLSTKNFNFHRKSINNWLDKDSGTPKNEKRDKDKCDTSSSANVINWMCLSPRERRRRFRHSNTSPTYEPKLPVLVEVPLAEPKSHDSLTKEPKRIQVTAEINIASDKSESNDHITVTDVDIDENENENTITTKTIIKKPLINFDRDRTKKINITDPMEKLNSNNWIQEETKSVELQKAADTIEPEITEIETDSIPKQANECAGKKLWMRNMSLLKPADWAEFLPITDSVPSLTLSIESSERSKLSWLKRLSTCFKCLK